MHLNSTLVTAAVLGLALLLLPVAGRADDACAPAPWPAVARDDHPISLKRLEAELRVCQPKGTCTAGSRTLYGITRIAGYLADVENHDIILFGADEPGLPALHVEDLAVALRNAAHRYVIKKDGQLFVSDPAVSIDPDPDVVRRLGSIVAPGLDMGNGEALERQLAAWCSTCELPQGVRVMGIPFDSRFASILVSADYLMKRIADGSAPLKSLEGLADAQMRKSKEEALAGRLSPAALSSLTRFWFHPGQHPYLEGDGQDAWLIRSDVILLNEAETATPDGRIVSTGKIDPASRAFACSFSRHFPELASAASPYPVYAELAALYRWSALAHLLVQQGAFEAASYTPGFLLEGLVVPEVKVPRTLRGVATVKAWDHVQTNGRTRQQIMLRLPSCGGVSMEFDRKTLVPVRDTSGKLRRLRSAVLASRPTPLAISWRVRD
jgi:hypothetical protein